VFSGMPPHIAHLKLKPGVSPSFFMHDELKMVCTAVLQYNNVIKTGSRCSGSNRKHTIPVWYSTNWSCRINVWGTLDSTRRWQSQNLKCLHCFHSRDRRVFQIWKVGRMIPFILLLTNTTPHVVRVKVCHDQLSSFSVIRNKLSVI